MFQFCHSRDERARGPEDAPPNWRKPSRNQQLRERIDAETNRRTDDRAVDADVLQVGADGTLELEHELLARPRMNLLFDEAADVRPIALDERRCRLDDLFIDERLHGLVRV